VTSCCTESTDHSIYKGKPCVDFAVEQRPSSGLSIKSQRCVADESLDDEDEDGWSSIIITSPNLFDVSQLRNNTPKLQLKRVVF